MKKTVGTADRIVRGVVAIVALIFAGVAGFSSGWGIVLTIVAAIMIITGATAYCPLYSATGLSTTGEGERHHRGAGAH
ncbi:MAG: YgaP family membrane protein [Acidimicrobiales bacterium]